MSLSLIGRSLSESATLKLNAKAASLRAKGEPVIHLGGGEPKSKAPAEAIAAGVEMLNTGEVRYTPADGIPALKKAVTKYSEEYYGHKIEAANVIVSGGAKQSIMVAMHAVLDPGDEFIFPTPYWVSYPDMTRLVGAKPVPVLPEDGSFYPKISDIERRVTPRTKAIIINSPNNPTGAMYSEQFIAGVVELCEKRDIYLLMDDIYHRLLFDGKQPISCYKFAKKQGEDSKLIVINGVSKQYAMTGFRIGWAVASRGVVEVMTNIQSHQTSGPCSISQVAAAAALNGEQSSVESLRAALEQNRNLMIERLKTLEKVKLSKPDGAFYCFADFSAYKRSSTELSQFLLNKALVVTVPGIEFGMEGHLRLSTCGSAKEITEGADRIRWALDMNSPAEIAMGDRKVVRDWA